MHSIRECNWPTWKRRGEATTLKIVQSRFLYVVHFYTTFYPKIYDKGMGKNEPNLFHFIYLCLLHFVAKKILERYKETKEITYIKRGKLGYLRPVSQKFGVPQFISSQRRGSKPSNFAIFLVLLTLKSCQKISV